MKKLSLVLISLFFVALLLTACSNPAGGGGGGNGGNGGPNNLGITWTAIPAGTEAGTSTFSGDIWDIAYGGGKFVAVGDYGRMAYSQ